MSVGTDAMVSRRRTLTRGARVAPLYLPPASGPAGAEPVREAMAVEWCGAARGDTSAELGAHFCS